jgi:polyisoprenoid-binding protein YceI
MLLLLTAFACTGETEPSAPELPAIPVPPAPEATPPAQPAHGGPAVEGVNNGPPPATKATVSAAEIKLIQVKNGSAEVGATITGVTGSLDFLSGEAAAGELKIDVGTWASGDAGRDTNVRGTFFKATEHPEATFTLESLEGLPEKPLLLDTEAMAVAKGTLSLYAGSVPVSANVKLSRGTDGYTLQTTEDFTVSIAGLGMSDNLTELMTLCAHKSVDDSVRVGISLTLTTD